ncbi:MAG: thiamine pyrophosphate-binding protein [Candidatus Thiodiazotropha sp. (ex Dulcina madagascariensis)]|nr:thiamine pyrophosphate-binding protein [Candidatus Thiodiazotropha sp. (ex Dulcina madagascariensis)]
MGGSGRRGRAALIEQLLADGIDHMFGNPGTVEQGFLDALRNYPAMRYILTLQESIAVLTADGYARATQKPALVQLHSSPGIGNAVGALYQAKRGHAPLLVIGGDAGLRYMNMDAQMAADLVAIMEPVTKYATMVLDPRSLLRTLRRAIKIAATPPMGPVYVCLPADVLDAVNEETVLPTSLPSTRACADGAAVEQAAEWLLGAAKPMIYIGDGVAYAQANDELRQVAELLGAEVYGVDQGDLNMDWTHPLYRGTTGHMFGEHSLPILRSGDVNLIVGTYMVPEVFPELGDIFAPAAKIIHFDLNAYEIAKNHRVDLGVVCDPKCSLAALAEAIAAWRSEARAAQIRELTTELAERKRAEAEADLAADDANCGRHPLQMAEFARALAAQAPDDLLVFDEALTASPELTRYLQPQQAGGYFCTRGGSLGVGIPGAIGAKLAHPERTVIGFTGDGGSMYTIQALWTAARHNVGAKFVICNNGSYRLLQLNIQQYWQDVGDEAHDPPLCFDLSDPPIHFTDLARSLNVDAVRVEKSAEIAPAIERMLADDRPFLIDLVLAGDTHPELIGVKCGQ